MVHYGLYFYRTLLLGPLQKWAHKNRDDTYSKVILKSRRMITIFHWFCLLFFLNSQKC